MTENKFVVYFYQNTYTLEEFVEEFKFKIIASNFKDSHHRYSVGKYITHPDANISYYKSELNQPFRVFNDKSSAIKYLVLKGIFLNKEET